MSRLLRRPCDWTVGRLLSKAPCNKEELDEFRITELGSEKKDIQREIRQVYYKNHVG